jgi:hypothetical protein
MMRVAMELLVLGKSKKRRITFTALMALVFWSFVRAWRRLRIGIDVPNEANVILF